VTSFVRHGLSRRRKVLLLHATDDVDAFALRLADGDDDDIATALDSGQLGYRGTSFTGDMSWRLTDPPGCEQLGEYEQCLAEILGDDAVVLLCQYDDGARADVTAAHDVDVASELAPIGRCGYLAAAFTGAGRTVRLARELDFEAAATVAAVIDERRAAPICLDLADLDFVDVAGLRALRGTNGHPVTISSASDAVRRLIALVGWDSDPAVELRFGYAV
jgi:anti-anti-sigma factor